MRFRSTSTGSLSSNSYTRTSSGRITCTGAFSASSTNYTGGSMRVKTIEDVKTSRFADLLKCGSFLPLNPTIIRTVETEKLPGTYDVSRYFIASGCPGNLASFHSGQFTLDRPSPQVSVPAVDPNQITAVVNGAVADCRSATWDVLTEIGELSETIRMFNNLGSRLNRDVLKYIGKGIKTPKQIASWWLGYRYGVMPIFYSIEDARKAFSSRRGIERIKGRSSVQLGGTPTWSSGDISIASGTRGSWTQTMSYNITLRGWAMGHSSWSNDFGFDPLVTAYELTTLSFVLDWFVDYGTWLQAISPFSPVTVDGTMYSIRLQSVWEASRQVYPVNDATTFGVGSGDNVFWREVVNEYARFPAAVSAPGWNPRLNLPRAIDAAALLLGALGSAYRRGR